MAGWLDGEGVCSLLFDSHGKNFLFFSLCVARGLMCCRGL